MADKPKTRGRPFTGRNDPRRNNGGMPPAVREVKAALALHGLEFVAALVRLARKGNPIAVKTGLEYVLGKPKQEVELTGKDGGPIETRHKVDPTKLSTEELRTLRAILGRAASGD